MPRPLVLWTIYQYARAPNPISKDMYAHKSSKLQVRDVWPTGLFKSEVLSDSGGSNNNEGSTGDDTAVMPMTGPPSECRHASTGAGSGPDQLGRSPECRRQPDVWRTFLDPTGARQAWFPYKQSRSLAWKVSRGVASGPAVSRTKAFKAIQLILMRGRRRLYEYPK